VSRTQAERWPGSRLVQGKLGFATAATPSRRWPGYPSSSASDRPVRSRCRQAGPARRAKAATRAAGLQQLQQGLDRPVPGPAVALHRTGWRRESPWPPHITRAENHRAAQMPPCQARPGARPAPGPGQARPSPRPRRSRSSKAAAAKPFWPAPAARPALLRQQQATGGQSCG